MRSSRTQVDGDSVDTLGNDLGFYERFSWKILASRAQDLAALYQVPWELQSVYYPWNRTFEIGGVLSATRVQ